MSVIVISKGSYSHGGEVARKVAQRLGYGCISRDILISTSKRFNISALRLIRAYEDAPSFLERYTFGREKYIKYISNNQARNKSSLLLKFILSENELTLISNKTTL